ncbi:MAG TPA: hypothetical protein DCE47_19760 [Planctomycetaceae bacterium]|nr:hypothetical protein [Planctomycetaceae bacterium]
MTAIRSLTTPVFRRLTTTIVGAAIACIASAVPAAPPQEPDATWWSLRPLTSPPAPRNVDSTWARTPVDAFVYRTLRRHGLTPSTAADRRTLMRRVTIDLTGLPPTPAEVNAFLSDQSNEAYPRLVERLMQSPRYGERWARHWLDVAHYGDTHGYDKDKLRPNAWPYRDYVVRAFNGDKPFDRFVLEQVAGDVLFPTTVDGVVATGFLAAGPWDYIGHAEVPETKIDGQVARNLDRDDMVRTVLNSFTSLTVQCARCHDHKFDDVSMEDYYSLQAVFSAIDRADRPYNPDPNTAARRAVLDREHRRAEQRLANLQKDLAARGGLRLKRVRDELDRLGRSRTRLPAYGYHSAIVASPDLLKWVQVDLGRPHKLAHILIVGCHDDFNNIGAGFGFPSRFRIEISNDPTFTKGVTALLDHTTADFPNPGTRPFSVPAKGQAARYIRVTATRLAPRQNDFIFALAELAAVDPQGGNVALGRAVTSLDSIEAPVRWTRRNLVDGHYDRVTVNSAILARAVELNRTWTKLRKELLTPELRARRQAIQRQLSRIASQVAALPKPAMVYAGTVHTGTGAFRGTGHQKGRPRPIHLLARGDIRRKGKLMEPGTVAVGGDLPTRFRLPANHREGDRRVALARWLIDRRNPLTWRSMANRIWQFHFGQPLVATPNDFGRMGEEPSHPELLDWLAARLRDGDGSLKDLHRQILLSAAYQQASSHRPAASEIDDDNRLLWRMNRRRIEAEVVRDSVLAVAGRLDGRMYGPGFQDFVIEKPQHSPHYQYHKHDHNDPRSHRRSVYRFLVRSQQQPFMTVLDCADPSRMVARRDETISPLQALAMLNNNFMTTMSSHFAHRVSTETPRLADQVRLAVTLALSRPPADDEVRLLTNYARRHGLPNTCRLIFNLNEFVFVE